MTSEHRYGDDARSSGGALTAGVLNRLSAVLQAGGVVAGGSKSHGWVLVLAAHPDAAAAFRDQADIEGLWPYVPCEGLDSVERWFQIGVIHARLFETYSPGPLALDAPSTSGASDAAAPPCIPDDPDLRALAGAAKGPLLCVEVPTQDRARALAADVVRAQARSALIAVVDAPRRTPLAATVAAVDGGEVRVRTQGAIGEAQLRRSAQDISAWEIEDWT